MYWAILYKILCLYILWLQAEIEKEIHKPYLALAT